MVITIEDIHELEKEIAVIKEKLGTIEKELAEHRRDFKSFKESDFRTFKDTDFKIFTEKMATERERYFEILLSKESFKDWIRDSFNPVKLIVWGMICMVAGAALTAGLTFLFRKSTLP